MNAIPTALKSELADDPYYRVCARRGLGGHVCDGRITWEHALIYANEQVQRRFAIIPLCAKAHSVDEWQDRGDLDKSINHWIALNRATDDELRSISKAIDYLRYRDTLNAMYGGKPEAPPLADDDIKIAY